LRRAIPATPLRWGIVFVGGTYTGGLREAVAPWASEL
jgi:hypothetical protein